MTDDGHRVSLDKNFVKLDCSEECTTLWIELYTTNGQLHLKIIELYTLSISILYSELYDNKVIKKAKCSAVLLPDFSGHSSCFLIVDT